MALLLGSAKVLILNRIFYSIENLLPDIQFFFIASGALLLSSAAVLILNRIFYPTKNLLPNTKSFL